MVTPRPSNKVLAVRCQHLVSAHLLVDASGIGPLDVELRIGESKTERIADLAGIVLVSDIAQAHVAHGACSELLLVRRGSEPASRSCSLIVQQRLQNSIPPHLSRVMCV